MSFYLNKQSFPIDEITGEVLQPQLFLCDRQLNNILEIEPALNLRIRCQLQGADEISFRVPEHSASYDALREYSIVFAKGFGYFEVSPTIHDSADETKEIHGASLGECELSQLLCTLECNTDSDIARDDYVPTVLCNKSTPKSSLLHRILSNYAPTYDVGHVDETIQSMQRTFSFSKLDILSCFSQIAEEINCFFDVRVQKAGDGTAIREINIYDATDGIGEDTTITIGTDHLSDEITLSTDDRMKNCFLVEGGDDLITNTINGINPSGNNKIYLFSEETINSFSPALRERYGNYVDNYRIQQPVCEEIYETECNIFDLILYLQSGRMPETDRSKRDLVTETDHILSTYKDYFPNGLGTLASLDSSSPNSTVRQIFSLLAGTGYAVRQEHGSYDSLDQKWTGDIIIYDVKNNDSRATIHISKESSTITYTTSDPVKHDTLCIQFSEDDQTYIRQRLACETKNVENIRSKTENAPKDWKKYSLKRLQSFRDSYYECIRILENLKKNSDLEPFQNMVDDFMEEYENYIEQISEYTVHLEDMIYFLYLYYGSSDKSNTAAPSSQDMDYSSSAYPNVYQTPEEAFSDMIHYIRYGTWLGGAETENTDCPLYCSSCGSTNIASFTCQTCGSSAVTYANLAQAVYLHCKNKNANLLTQRTYIHNQLDLKTFLGDDLYKELYSHIREDVYTNSNFVSDGMEMNNSKLIRHAKELLQKAEHELARACVPQYTLTGNVYSFAAYRTLNSKDFPIPNAYDKFILGNFMRYISRGGTIYKLCLSSEEFSWEDHDVSLNVEFTNVVRSADHSIRDIETLIQQVGNLASSFDCVKKQAEQGEAANQMLDAIKKEGLYSALGNVLNARNQDIQITENGITLREYDPALEQFDKYQMKLINRNLVMTEDNWKTAKMAIGLGQYGKKPVYGVWADLLVGNMIAGKDLLIQNDKGTVEITGDGISIKSGSINISGTDNQVIIDPKTITNKDYIFAIKHDNDFSVGIKPDGTAAFKGNITATSLTLIDGCKLPYSSIIDVPEIPSDIKDLTDTDNTLNNIMYKGDITSTIKTDRYGNTYTEHTVPNGTPNPITYTTYSTDSYVLFGRSAGSGEMGGEGTYVCISKDGLLQANNAVIYGTIYASDGEFSGSIKCGDDFSVTNYGRLTANNGYIGGWRVFPDSIEKDWSTETEGRKIKLDSKNYSITATHRRPWESGPAYGNPEEYSYVRMDGDGLTYRLANRENRSEELNYHKKIKLTPYGLIGMTDTEDSIYYSIGAYDKKGHVSDTDHSARFNCPIYYYEKPLGESYCVVQTGSNECLGTGGWKRFSATFNEIYESEPFINVMPTTGFTTENIMFDGFHGSPENGYTGFDYSIYCANPEFSYKTKWFAVGNVKR